MLKLIILIVIIYFIVSALKGSKKKKKTTTTTTPPTKSAPTPAKAAPKAATPAKKAAAPADDAFSGVDKDAFARAMAAMSGDAPAPKEEDSAADRDWVRRHPFTDYICGFYAGSWKAGGGLYEKVNSGELPIARLVLEVQREQIHETLYLKDGGSFDSDTTFESLHFNGKYASLDSAAKRDELLQCITQTLSALPTISAKADGFHIITGISAAAPKKEAPAKAAPAGDDFPGVDKDAFARAMAAMSGDAPAPVKEEPKPEPPKPEAPKAEAPKAEPTPANYDAFLRKVLDYYHSMWNKDTGSLYTELDSTMPIDHFAVQVRENCLVESVWLQGDDIPLVTETEYTKLCGDVAVYPMSGAEEQTQLLIAIAKYLVELGTVEVKGNDFYPIRAKKAPVKSDDGGKTAEEFSESEKEAALRAQIQALLEQQKKDDDKK